MQEIIALTKKVEELDDEVRRLQARVSVSGMPPHKISLKIMTAALVLCAMSIIICIFLAFETYLLLQKVHAIYSLML